MTINRIFQLINLYKQIKIIEIMAEKIDADLLEFCPNEFELEHYNLSALFCYAGIGVDNHILRRNENPDYLAVIRAGKILYQYAQRTKTRIRRDKNKINPFTDIFFLNFLQELGERPETVEDIANSVMQIGLDLIKLRELPDIRQRELRGLCVKLSEKTANYWQEYHPTGFRQYCAA